MSITKKLFLIMTIMAVLITTELVALNYTMDILSAVRAYVGGEGLWSKAQKNGAYYLVKYAYTFNEKDYQNFLNFMKVPLSDHQARLALNKNPIDYSAAREGFIGGNIYPDDVDGIIWLFHRFNRVYYINKAINVWAKGDLLLSEFIQQGDRLHQSISTHHATSMDVTKQLANIDKLNDELTVVENEFSYTLGLASRWLEDKIFKLLISIAITVEFTGILLTILTGFKISRDINAMNKIASKVAKSDFSERINISSKDEMGRLAISFNKMIDELDKHNKKLTLSEKKLLEKTRQIKKANEILERALKEQQKVSQELSDRTRSLEEQTAKTKVEQSSKNLLLNTLESSTEYSIVATDLAGVILVWNEGAHRLYGYNTDEMVKKNNIRILFAPEDLKTGQVDKFFETVMHEEKHESIFERIRKDGSRFLASFVTTLRRDDAGNPVGYDMISKDITKQKQLEEQLIRNNQELEQFAYITSHDLKAPLRAIEGLAGWIEEDCGDKLDKRSKDNLMLLRNRVKRMSNLISGILQYSRTGHMNLQIHSIDTKQLLQGIIESLNPSQNINIHFADHLPTLEADEIQLGQVFSNLIDNSIKHHNHKTGNIEIGVRDLGNFFEFFVKDDGPGIAPEYHKKIFEIFQTLKSKDELESTGIGLSIVKKIVEFQGGKITVDSEQGAGATFYFTWPKYPNIETK